MTAVAVDSFLQIYAFGVSVGFFSRLYRIHLHSQDIREQKIRFLPHYPSRGENSPLNLMIPEEKFGPLSAISADDGESFRLFRALYSHKARCLNQ